MHLNLFSNEKLHLLALLQKQKVDLKKLFGRFFATIKVVKEEKEFQKEFEENPNFYDIVLLEYSSETTCSLFNKLHTQNETLLHALLIDKNNTDILIRALHSGIDAVIPTPICKNTDLLTPMLKLITIKNNEKDLKVSNFLIEQKERIIDENVLMSIADLQGTIINISQAYSSFTGYSKDELIGKNHSFFRTRKADKEVIKNLWETLKNDRTWQGEFSNQKKNGETFIVRSTITPLRGYNGEKIGYLNIINDITDVKRLEELAITDSLTTLYNRRYFDFIVQREIKSCSWRKEHFALAILDVDYFKNYNDHYGHATGDKALRTVANILKSHEGKDIDYTFRIGGEEFALIATDRSDIEIKSTLETIIKEIEAQKIPHEKSAHSKYLTASIGALNIRIGEFDISHETLYNIVDENLYKAKRTGRNRVVFDIDTLKLQSLRKDRDVITGLPNRNALLDDLALLHDEAMLVLLHVEHIRSLQELYGAETVMNLIKEKTRELQSILQDTSATLYTLNMEEFALLVTEKSLFNKYLELVKYSILSEERVDISSESVENYTITSFTAGVAYGLTNLYLHANTALQEARFLNKKIAIFNNNDIKQNEAKLLEIERLKVYKKALHEDRIIPYFQPIIDVRDNSFHKFEALARIQLEDGSIIAPNMFLKSSMNDKTYEFFTRQIMQKIFKIYAKNNEEISININYQNIISETMLAYIENRLQKYGGERITFEIVETEDIKDYSRFKDFISLVKKYGAKISIDDFGSGYSNFTNLLHFELDYLKIDGTLVEQLLDDQNVENMVKSIIDFSHKAGIKVIAEYVSTVALDRKVRELGVDYIQGYLYGEPKAPQEYGLITPPTNYLKHQEKEKE